MIRVTDMPATLPFSELLGLEELERYGNETGNLAFALLASLGEPVGYTYAVCQRLHDGNITNKRPPRDGHMTLVRAPHGVSVETLQVGARRARVEPLASMAGTRNW